MSISKEIVTKFNPVKFKENFLKLPSTVKREGWNFYYDKNSDSFYFTPKVVDRKSALLNLTRELAVFINRESEIKGFFIENFSANFVQHHANYKGLLKNLKNKVGDDVFTLDNQDKLDNYTQMLEGFLLESINNKDELVSIAKSKL